MNRRTFLASPLGIALLGIKGDLTPDSIEIAPGVRIACLPLKTLRLRARDYRLYMMDNEPPRAWASDKFAPSGVLVSGKGMLFVSTADISPDGSDEPRIVAITTPWIKLTEGWKLGTDRRPVAHFYEYVDAAGRRCTARS